ncbi:hypothetical protein AX15_005146 [Amanita polypyramis BW_CC]|nr:hypothetical protein AX15_005146 [Amanita polypyramis BW_CC]
MGSPQTSASPSDPSEILVPTTELITLECPRFRILILGRSGVGKSSLINTIFKVNFADVQDSQAGRADINEEITSEHNKHLVVHDSQGYETADTEKFNTLTSFILKRSRKDRVADRLHAIWLCIPVPFAGGRVLEIGDEKIFEYQNKVPIIVVFTKFDLLVASVMARTKCSSIDERQRCSEIARKEFKDKHSQAFKNLTKNISSTVPHVLVAISLPNTLEQLVKVTMQNIHVVNNTRLATSTPKSISQLLPAQDRLSAPVPQSSGNSRLTTESLSSTEPQPSTLSPSPSLPPSAATQQVRLRSGSIWFKKWFGKRNKVLNDNKLAMSESNLSQPVRSVDRPPENNSHLSLPGGARLDNSSDPAQREEDSANNSDQIPRRNESHDFSDIVKISLVMAQRVDPEIKIAASIRVGKKSELLSPLM